MSEGKNEEKGKKNPPTLGFPALLAKTEAQI